MTGMHPQPKLIRFALPLGLALILSACAGAGPGWTYAPLGPSAPPSANPTTTPVPSGLSAPTVTIEVKTTGADSLNFDPKMIEVPANTVVQINYLNDSSLPHNIDFFAGADQSAASLGKTDIVTGPGALKSVIFTTPATPGDYLFWCDVHTTGMTGMLHVTP
jgi:Copper binding proteins, plastocyanin/azurin family.